MDVVRLAAKRLGGNHTELAVTTVAVQGCAWGSWDGGPVPETWSAQLHELGAEVWWDTSQRSVLKHR